MELSQNKSFTMELAEADIGLEEVVVTGEKKDQKRL